MGWHFANRCVTRTGLGQTRALPESRGGLSCMYFSLEIAYWASIVFSTKKREERICFVPWFGGTHRPLRAAKPDARRGSLQITHSGLFWPVPHKMLCPTNSPGVGPRAGLAPETELRNTNTPAGIQQGSRRSGGSKERRIFGSWKTTKSCGLALSTWMAPPT